MLSPVSWTKDLEVGRPEIDSQHEGLFELSDQLELAGSKEIRACVLELYKYTRVHFQQEEKFLEEIGYPLIEEHQKLHLDLISTLNEKVSAGFETQESIADFRQFYTQWLASHILTEDKKYIIFEKLA